MSPRIPELAEAGVSAKRFGQSPLLLAQPRVDLPAESAAGVRFERVLVPVDLSAGTLDVLRQASGLVQPGSLLRVVHAVQLNIAGEERGVPRLSLIRELRDTARAELEKLINSLWKDEVPAVIIIREGRPRDVILQEAHTNNADLIVMGAHQRGAWRRFFHSNTAEHVMRYAPCPVLVVRNRRIAESWVQSSYAVSILP